MSMRGIHWIIYWWFEMRKYLGGTLNDFYVRFMSMMYHAYWTNIVYVSVFVGVLFRFEHLASIHQSCSPISFLPALSHIYLISIHVFSVFLWHFAETVVQTSAHIWNWIVCGHCMSVSYFCYLSTRENSTTSDDKLRTVNMLFCTSTTKHNAHFKFEF